MDEVFLRTSVKDKGMGDAGSAVHSFFRREEKQMIMQLIIGWMRILAMLIVFWTLSEECRVKREWKYQILTITTVGVCIAISVLPFSNISVRYLIEMVVLYFYTILYCKKNIGRNFMYLTMICVAIDVIGVFTGMMAYVLQGCSPGENYQFVAHVMAILTYIILLGVFPLIQRGKWFDFRKNNSSIAVAGMSFCLLFAKGVVLAFVGSGDENSNVYWFLTASFLFALGVCVLWALNKKVEDESRKELIRYHHREKEVFPTVERVLEKMKDLSGDSEELNKTMAELQELCHTDEKLTRAEALAAKAFVSTGSPLLDDMLERYLLEAAHKEIEVDIIVQAPISPLLKGQKIEIGLLLRMFGDIYRNAEKVVLKKGDEGQVLICMGNNQDGEYEISVYDNGAAFPRHVLKRLGQRGVTTDGTGHGMADVFEVLDKYKISYMLEQHFPKGQMFTKVVRLIFDGQGRRVIC